MWLRQNTDVTKVADSADQPAFLEPGSICHSFPGAVQPPNLQVARHTGLTLGLLLGTRPLVGLFFGLFLRDSVSLLNPPDQLLFLAGDRVPIVIGEFAPLTSG